MKPIVQISDLPNVLSIDELLEVKGGLVDNAKICAIFGLAFKCTAEGSGVCTTQGSGICTTQGSGVIVQPDPKPNPGPGTGTTTCTAVV